MARKNSRVEREHIVTARRTWLLALNIFDLLFLWILAPIIVFFVVSFAMYGVEFSADAFDQIMTAFENNQDEYLVILGCSLIPAVIVFLWRLVLILSHKLVFFQDCVIDRWGVISKYERKTTFLGIVDVSLDQNFFQKLLCFGKVEIHVVGKKFHIDHMARPNHVLRRLKKYYLDDQDFHSVSL